MVGRYTLRSVVLFVCLTLISQVTHARRPPPPEDPKLQKEGTDYVGIGYHFNRWKSIELVLINPQGSTVVREFPVTAHTSAMSLTYGTYVTDHIKTEFRYGRGWQLDSIGEGSMELNLNNYFTWHIGGAYAVTDYATAYAQYGVSVFDTKITRYVTERFIPGERLELGRRQLVVPSSVSMEEKLLGENFSTSWMVGLDFSIITDWILTFEYGRLLNDPNSGIKVYQASTILKYEF